MTVFTEGRHAAEFIMSEANGKRSRENGTVKSGEDLAAGEVVMLDGATLVAYAGGTDDEAVGIIIPRVDATGGAVAAAYIARDAEVNGNILTYPEGTLSAVTADLAALGIIVR